MKKVILTLLIVAMIGVSCFAFMACADKTVNVGFQNGTTGQYYTEGYANLTPKGYTNATLAVQDMIAGRLDYVVTDIAPAKSITSKMQGKVKVIDIPLTAEEYCYAVNPNDTKGILDKLNKFLEDNKAAIEELENAYVEGTNEENVIMSADPNKAKNPLKVATSPDFPPFENISGEGYVGIDLEIMKMFCDEYGYDLVIVEMEFDSIVLNVGQGKADIGAAALTWSEERAKSVKFSSSYYAASQVIITMANDKTFDNCKTKEDVEAVIKSLGK